MSAPLDGLSIIFAKTLGIVTVPIIMYSARRDEAGLGQIALWIAFVASSLASVLTRNLYVFVVSWELMLIFSYLALLADRGRPLAEDDDADYISLYLIMHVIAGGSLLLGAVIQYTASGSTVLGAVHTRAAPFFLLACLIKTGMFPFHTWVVETYSRASLGTAVVLSAFTTKVGVYTLIRTGAMNPSFGPLAMGTTVFAAFMALRQQYMRRLLSYHLVSQIAFAVVGIAASTDMGVLGAAFHAVNNAVYKTVLFMAAGIFLLSSSSENLKTMKQSWKKTPLLFLILFSGAAAISGVPPFNGFVSKSLLSYGTASAPLLKWGLIASSIGTAMSFSKVLWFTFLRPHPQQAGTGKPQAGAALWLPPLVLSGLSGIIGVAYRGYLPADIHLPTLFTTGKMMRGLVPACIGVAAYAALMQIGVQFAGEKPWDLDVPYRHMALAVKSLARAANERMRDSLQDQLIIIVAALILLSLLLTGSR